MELLIIFMMILTGSMILISIFMLVVYMDSGLSEFKKSYKEGFVEFIDLTKIFFKKRITKYTNGRQVK